jgi:hypothetical protein
MEFHTEAHRMCLAWQGTCCHKGAVHLEGAAESLTSPPRSFNAGALRLIRMTAKSFQLTWRMNVRTSHTKPRGFGVMLMCYCT